VDDKRISDRIKLASFPQKKYLKEIVMEELPKDAQVVLPEIRDFRLYKEGTECRYVRQSWDREDTFGYSA